MNSIFIPSDLEKFIEKLKLEENQKTLSLATWALIEKSLLTAGVIKPYPESWQPFEESKSDDEIAEEKECGTVFLIRVFVENEDRDFFWIMLRFCATHEQKRSVIVEAETTSYHADTIPSIFQEWTDLDYEDKIVFGNWEEGYNLIEKLLERMKIAQEHDER